MFNLSGKTATSLQQRVAVALSGGVDSAVAAALLKEQGHDVFGITVRLYEPESGPVPADEARRVAEKLGIALHVVDLRQRFAEVVMEPFAASYARGETPNPCALCNYTIKFGDLAEVAHKLGAAALATGHYARRVDGKAGPELHCGTDESRDQSYFLFAMPYERLSFLWFPLGKMTKADVRAEAMRRKLPVAVKPDSQDICFVPHGDYGNVVRRFHPEAFMPGDIVDEQGRVLGRHDGITHFTVGQRRGLNLHDRIGESNEPLFVLRLEAARHRVVVGPRAALAVTEVGLSGVNWLAGEVPEAGLDATVRLRSMQMPVPALFFRSPAGADGRIVLHEPAFGVAPGQAGVIYCGTRVMGGGWIKQNSGG